MDSPIEQPYLSCTSPILKLFKTINHPIADGTFRWGKQYTDSNPTLSTAFFATSFPQSILIVKGMAMAKVVFINLAPNFYDKHAIYSLSSLLAAQNHSVHYIPNIPFKKILNRLEEIRPELVLYSSFTPSLPKYFELDRLVKERLNVKSLIGGNGPTYDPDLVANSTIDALCMGEGEAALIDYVDSDFSGTKNIIERGDITPDRCNTPDYFAFTNLDDLPMPRRHLVYEQDSVLKNQPSKQFMAGRGCPYKCTYCHNHAFNEKFKDSGEVIRYKSVDYLIEEIKEVQHRYPLKTVVFQDDVFILKKSWVMEFCEKFPREIGLGFTCNVKAEITVQEDIVKALKEANCVGASWSIESGNEFLRNEVLKRNTSKSQILRCSENLNKYKIPHRIGNVIGIPGEKFENMRETIELNIEAKPTMALANIFVPYPGLELTDYALKHNFVDQKDCRYPPEDIYQMSVLKFSPEQKLQMHKILFLFPYFVRYPSLYFNETNFKLLLQLPRWFLRFLYEPFYVFNMAKIHRVWASIRMTVALFRRYISTAVFSDKSQ
ncbi:MAG: radical SAM protein [Nitrospinaceae bacterium]|nr:radical SAM protein [Nitrospinaceae bacterium]|tara:strand:+ start:259 stop:1902 length:1644 start_codon:yes stop_codon:yes gene_type:complete